MLYLQAASELKNYIGTESKWGQNQRRKIGE